MPTIKQLSRIMSDDVALNRVQDQLASALNPILRNVQGDLTGPLESPTVKGLRGITISQVRPILGQTLVYNGTEWAPAIGGGGGIITSVTAPLVVTSGVLSIPAADATTDGYLTSADWVAFDSKVSAVTATAPMSSTGGTTPDLSMTQSDATTDGWLSSTDWNTFNNKVGPGDPTVVLLMSGTGATGSTTFLDTGYLIAPLTSNGAPVVVATPSIFGGGSAYLNGASYISAATNVAYNFGTGDFTIEAWVYPNVMSGDYFVVSAAGSGGLFFGFRGGTNIGLGRAAIAWDYDTPSGMTTGSWYFVTLCRSGSDVRLFVDGVQVGTTQTLTYAYDLGVTNLCIGSQGAAFFYNGYMNDVRVSNIARYTTNFTPPVAPFPNASPPSYTPTGVAGGVLNGNYPNPNGIKATTNLGTNAYVPIVWDNVRENTWLSLSLGAVPAGMNRNLGLIGPTSSLVGSTLIGPGSAILKGGVWSHGVANAAGGSAVVIGGDGSIGGLFVNSGPGADAFLLGGTGGDANTPAWYGAGGNARVRGGTGYDATITTLWGNAYVGDANTKAVELANLNVPTKTHGQTVWTPKTTQTITAATASFDPTRTYLPFDVSGGNYTLTSTPTILTANAVAGQFVLLHNIGTTNHIKLSRGVAEALSLAATNQTIDPGGSMMLVFDGAYWNEVAHITATST
jgi:hypothetical protein